MAASVGGPLLENVLAGQLSVYSKTKGSQFTASDGGALGEQDTQAISGTLVFKPDENSSIKLKTGTADSYKSQSIFTNEATLLASFNVSTKFEFNES